MADLPNRKPILCLDFDGVIHSYISGWKGARIIPDPPVDGAMAFVYHARSHFDLQIYSSRSRYCFGRRAMKSWLRDHMSNFIFVHFSGAGIPFDQYGYLEAIQRLADKIIRSIKFPTKKPAAFLQIDDRAICFNGTFPSIDEIKSFKPWYRK